MSWRSFGCRARATSTAALTLGGTSGRTAETGAGVEVITCATTACMEVPRNGVTPVSISNRSDFAGAIWKPLAPLARRYGLETYDSKTTADGVIREHRAIQRD